MPRLSDFHRAENGPAPVPLSSRVAAVALTAALYAGVAWMTSQPSTWKPPRRPPPEFSIASLQPQPPSGAATSSGPAGGLQSLPAPARSRIDSPTIRGAFTTMDIVESVLRRVLPAAMVAAAFPALAQPQLAMPQVVLPQVEMVTSTALRDKQIQQYVQSHAVASRVAGKLGRWEIPICIKAQGLKPELLEFVVKRVKAVAVQVGAPVNNDPSCRQNVEIGFDSNPQSVMDHIRGNHRAYLGFHNNSEEAGKMARMTHPIQAWYATATIDANNQAQSDQPRREPPQCFDPPWCRVMVSANTYRSTGTRVSDGLRTGFVNVIVLADRDRLVKMEMGAVADYISFLVLAQPASLDDCMELPSILNALAPNCATESGELSPADIAYLTALYHMNTDRLLAGQKEQIAFQMKKALGTR